MNNHWTCKSSSDTATSATSLSSFLPCGLFIFSFASFLIFGQVHSASLSLLAVQIGFFGSSTSCRWLTRGTISDQIDFLSHHSTLSFLDIFCFHTFLRLRPPGACCLSILQNSHFLSFLISFSVFYHSAPVLVSLCHFDLSLWPILRVFLFSKFPKSF